MAQPGYWTTNLLDASLQSGDEELFFPVADRNVDGGRDWASRKYPFRDGQSDEDTGGRPRSLTYSIPLFRGVEEDHYPNGMNDLVEFVESAEHRGRAVLTDPEWGPLDVRMTGFTWVTNSKQRDGGELQLTFETLTDRVLGVSPVDGNGSTTQADAAAEADALDSALADADVEPKDTAGAWKAAGVPITETERIELGLSETFAANIGLAPGVTVSIPTAPAVASFSTTVTSTSGFGPTTVADDEVRPFSAVVGRFQDMVERGDLERADEIAAELDRIVARAGAVRDDTTLTSSPEKGWPVFAASSALIAAAQRVAARAFRDEPLVLDYTLTKESSAFEVAVELFSDPSRVQDIITLNPSLSPDFYDRGAALIVPLE